MPLALTRVPSPRLADCELTCLARVPIDLARALEQHAAYRAILAELGCEVVELEPLPEHPDGVFVEDTAIVLDNLAVLTRPGAVSRRGELPSVAEALRRHREVVALEAPATLDGGDVVRVGDTLYVGQSTRTNHAGLRQLAHLVLGYGWRVKAAPVRGCLHLKSAVSALPDGRLLVNEDWVELANVADHERISVDPREPHAANVLCVGDVVLVDASFPRTAERVTSAGYEVRTIDASELQKAEGALTCQSLIVSLSNG